jgi:hypothetical protein
MQHRPAIDKRGATHAHASPAFAGAAQAGRDVSPKHWRCLELLSNT